MALLKLKSNNKEDDNECDEVVYVARKMKNNGEIFGGFERPMTKQQGSPRDQTQEKSHCAMATFRENSYAADDAVFLSHPSDLCLILLSLSANYIV